MRPDINSVLLFILALLICVIESDTAKTSPAGKHRFKQLTSRRTRSVAECSTIDPLFQYDLPAILKPRVPGTSSHAEVKNYIQSRLQQLGPRWEVTLDPFSAHTPFGETSFTNIIATLDPHVDRRLVLTAHYDSKIIGGSIANSKFLGATDSALPCALLLDLVHSLNSKLQTRKLQDFSLQLIFFDGEEAFVRWSATDSIYGSRHLASEMSKHHGMLSVGNKTGIQAMEAFILLDLLGARAPTFHNYFEKTSHLYEQFMSIEQRLDKIKHLEDHSKPYFPSKTLTSSRIEDDHIPFHRKGVPILHLITSPFPSVWHKLSDNLSALHKPTIANLRKMFAVFLHEYFILK